MADIVASSLQIKSSSPVMKSFPSAPERPRLASHPASSIQNNQPKHDQSEKKKKKTNTIKYFELSSLFSFAGK
jgi:hypothetical protein